MNWITNSFFDIFKIGPGPSSSHTIGPMLAAGRFLKRLAEVEAADLPLEIHLYGSLALTGKGHGSDRAAVAGLLGEKPESCDTVRLAGLLSNHKEEYVIQWANGSGRISGERIFFHREKNDYPYANTIVFRAGDLKGVYYSIGGGFVLADGESENSGETPDLPYRYRSVDTFGKVCALHGMTPTQVLLANECAVSGRTEAEVRAGLDGVIDSMWSAVDRGLQTTGVLPGILGVGRRAAEVFSAAGKATESVRGILMLDAFALAAAEENAQGNLVVTAPTSGSSGILPSLICYLLRVRHTPRHVLQEALMLSAMFAFVSRHNASISGAEVGCQGEIGVASAMGAALLAVAEGGGLAMASAAAEIALEHHLGLSCDPVAGYVQVPCIERNAIGTVTAFNAWLLASSEPSRIGKVSFDEALEAMYETGRRMNSDFKETSRGGLALCCCCM